MVAAHDVVGYLQVEESAAVTDLEAFIAKTIQFRAEPGYSREQFDIILLQ
jgi:ribonuclease G